MIAEDARAAVIAAIGAIAPDVDLEPFNGALRLRQDLELDSLDFLELLQRLSDSTGATTSEEDYPGLVTVQQLIDHVAARGST
jgi:acyl carrier protein